MKKNRIFAAALTAIFAALPFTMEAIPAMPGLRAITQSDGTVLNARLVGDEYGHMWLSEDNYPMTQVDGIFYFATTDASGCLVSSGIRAQAPEMRSQEAQNFLRKVNADSELAAVAERNIARREAIQAPHFKTSDDAPMRITGTGIPEGSSMLTFDFPHLGEHRSPVVLVEYTDVKFQIANPKEFFNRMTNEEGFSEYDFPGSIHDYFVASSNGRYKPVYDVYEPITLAHEMAYYGANVNGEDVRPNEMVLEAVDQLAAKGVDFSKYDANGDGYIDNIVVIYAGEGEGTGGVANSVWQHLGWAQGTKEYNGVKVDVHVCVNEWMQQGMINQPSGMGVFVHEFSHALGLPDEYDPYYKNTNTPGPWSVMDMGCHLNYTLNPCLHSVYEAYCLGWNDVEILEGPQDLVLQPHGKCYAIDTDKRVEFYMFEARYPEGWDAYFDNSGLLVWHIDYSGPIWKRNTPNMYADHMRIDLIEADNKEGDGTRKNDPFPGRSGQYNEFSATTTPALLAWSGYDMGLALTNITRNDDKTVSLSVTDSSGISAIEKDDTNTAPVEYFDVYGRRVIDPAKGQLLIRRQGDDVQKILN